MSLLLLCLQSSSPILHRASSTSVSDYGLVSFCSNKHGQCSHLLTNLKLTDARNKLVQQYTLVITILGNVIFLSLSLTSSKLQKKMVITQHVWFSKSVGIHFSFVYIMRMLKMCLPTCHRQVNEASGKCIFVSV